MNRTQTVLSSVIVASLCILLPFAASAATVNATGSTGVTITPNGIVRVIGADVTSVSNGVVNALTTIGTTVLHWVVDVTASTKLSANDSKNATTSDIKVGDTIGFTGALLSSIGSTLTVAATEIRDLTSFHPRHIGAGTISSIDSVNGSFVITEGSHTVTVQTNASTTFFFDGGTSDFAALTTGEKVAVVGTPNTDGSVITASNIVVKNSSGKGEGRNDTSGDADHGSAHVTINAGASSSGNATSDNSNGNDSDLNFLGDLHFRLGKDN